jgi:hypothetical protein
VSSEQLVFSLLSSCPPCHPSHSPSSPAVEWRPV